MALTLRSVEVPSANVPTTQPEIPPSLLVEACEELYRQAQCDWVVVYGDREHVANMMFLTGFDPRFEEALFLLGPQGKRCFIVGNECLNYAAAAPIPGATVLLAQSLSLMGQDRSLRPSLEDSLRECGMVKGDRIGVVGWKYLEPEEWSGDQPAFFVPDVIIALLSRIAGTRANLTDVTALLMHPQTGLRSIAGPEYIALFEWAAARSSAALWRVIAGITEGESEYEAASRMGYEGELFSCHMMLTSAPPDTSIISFRSPSARRVRKGDCASGAIGYWGGLSGRAGLIETQGDAFLDMAKGYFESVLAWYEAADLGVTGGEIDAVVTERLARIGMSPALNPGHLISFEEWSHSPIRPGSAETMRSGMPFQVDIIPAPMSAGWKIKCEDGIVFADPALRAKLKSRYPEMYQRIEARRQFIRSEIGIDLKDSILPLSATPLCMPPFWLTPGKILTRI
jgi:Xaa-Pro aminopeptidase